MPKRKGLSRNIKKEKKRKEKKQSQANDDNFEDGEFGEIEPKVKQVPRTVESSCVKDTIDVDDEEVQLDIKNDEFEAHWDPNAERNPKVLITTTDNPHVRTIQLARELQSILPKSDFRFRNRSATKKIIKGCIERDFTDLMIINENRREPCGLMIVHLPNGPTATFKLSSVKLTTDLRKSTKAPVKYNKPEVILNNFSSRLGQTVGRMLACLFPRSPKFKYQSVCTFHNQRDFIFFRYHRYQVDEKDQSVSLHEVGPQMTMKLTSLQSGTYDPQHGEYEWMLKRHEMQTSRKRFYL